MKPDEILDVLDAQSATTWPQFHDIATNEYYAMRLVVLCERGTDDWGLIFEKVAGSSLGHEHDPATVGVTGEIYGPSVPSHAHFVTPKRPCALTLPDDVDDDAIDGVTVTGPAGPLRFEREMVARDDLRPEYVCNLDHAAHPHMLLVRAYLAKYPGSLFPPLADTVRALSGTVDDVLLTSDSFEHVVSPSLLTGDAERDRFAMRPSASPTYRSLADAIAFRDATRFVPGASNLDWRRWARNSV